MIDRADELMTHDNSTLEQEIAETENARNARLTAVAAAAQAAQEKQDQILPKDYYKALDNLHREINSLEAQRDGLQRELRDNNEFNFQCLKLIAHLIKQLT